MNKIAWLLILLATPVLADVDRVWVVKSDSRMYLLDGDDVVREFQIALGGDPQGHKVQEGDQRTPEGRYTLDYKKEDSSAYRAMHVSYPNEADTANADSLGVSPGGFIMVHGQLNWLGWLAPITQRFNWTNGCIALTNKEMDVFMDMVAVGTPIDIEW